jgi:hypothetical protein
MSRFFKSFLIVALLAGFIAGCGGGVDETYVAVSLRDATRGDVLSPGFKFAFESPEFVSVHGNVGLVREGNLIEIFVGDGLEEEISKLSGGRFTVGARKFFEPVIHFNVDFLVVGSDTTMVGMPYEAAVPNLLKTRDFSTDDFDEIDLSKITSNRLTLKDLPETRFKIRDAKIMYEMIGEEERYTIHLPNTRLIVTEPGDDIILVLKALMDEKLYFSGGVSYGSIPSQAFRRDYDSAGEVTIDYIEYGNRFVVVR